MTDADGAENPNERVADGLSEVVWAIEGVDYNALMEEDLAALMDAYGAVMEMTLRYRQDRHATERRD